MGNLVGIGVYHLQNSFTFTERVWRVAKSWRNENDKHVFRLEIPFGNFGLPFEKSRFLRKLPFGKTKIGLPFTFQPKFPDFLVTGKQPLCSLGDP